MTTLLMACALALAAIVLCLVTSLQTLYLESLRLRAREFRSLELFKETLQGRIGLEGDKGALTFSLIKHTLLVLVGVLSLELAASENVPKWEALAAGCLGGAVTMLVAAYVIPQVSYRRSSGKWMLALAPFYRALALAVAPCVWLLTFFHSLFELSNGHAESEETTDPSEHIDALISAGEEEGIIEADDRKLIQSVVAFGDKTVREVMTPRPKIVAIPADRTLEDLRQLVIHEQYSRIPVYEENIDQIAGFVHVRDMFELDPEALAARQVRELVRPINLAPETKPVNDLLREMQEDGAHMAIVIDEYGNTAGLVTMEDMVEEILGEIRDEHEPTSDVAKQPDGSYVVAGSFDVGRLQELMDFKVEEETESTTVGGLVTEWLGHVPAVGESAQRDGIQIHVLAASDLRVDEVKISRVQANGQ